MRDEQINKKKRRTMKMRKRSRRANSSSSTLLTSEIRIGWRERSRELTRRITDWCQHFAF